MSEKRTGNDKKQSYFNLKYCPGIAWGDGRNHKKPFRIAEAGVLTT
jgi:hypothetical protein